MTVALGTRSARLSTGVTLPYVEQGDRSGIPIIFLHGVTDSWRSFGHLLPFLPQRFHALAVTQRGHGEADKPDDGYLMSDFAADLAAFMDTVGVEAAVIAGSSMGSSVAQRFALDYPERVRSVVLMAAFHSFHDKPELVEFADKVIGQLVDPIDRSVAQEFQESTLAKPIRPAQLDTFVSESMKVPAHVWRAIFNGIISDDAPIEPDRVKTPTLIVWGDQDAYCPRSDQEMLMAAFPNSRLIVYHGHGHATHWEDPVRVARDIVAFVDGLEP